MKIYEVERKINRLSNEVIEVIISPYETVIPSLKTLKSWENLKKKHESENNKLHCLYDYKRRYTYADGTQRPRSTKSINKDEITFKNYYNTKEEAIKRLNNIGILEYIDIENIKTDSLPFYNYHIRATMHIFKVSYTIAIVKLLMNEHPLLEHFYKSPTGLKQFFLRYSKTELSEAYIHKIPFLEYICRVYRYNPSDLVNKNTEYYNHKPSLEECIETYLYAFAEDIRERFFNITDDNIHKYLVKRAVAIISLISINDLSVTKLAEKYNIGKGNISNYIYNISSKEISNKIDEILINLDQNIKKYL